ncbi:hypothetical protein ACOMHN_019905 [Nucella lapillus]
MRDLLCGTLFVLAAARLTVGAVQCDATHECPSGQTCCKLASGQWGCCPLPQAVCCQDHVHCCPNGYTCDPSSGNCDKGSITLPWLEKSPATVNTDTDQGASLLWESERLEAVKCDATYECPTGNTCCKTTSKQWGCCPSPKAVCCQDHEHCCPEGYRCDPSSKLCKKNPALLALPWLHRHTTAALVPVLPQEEVEAVQCDATHECPTGNTCCKTASGQWGCCPLPQAVCCQDHVHCCPNGYTCDPSAGKCEKGFITLPWLEKQPATITAPQQEEVEAVQCDVTHECPTGNTCCKTTSGQWGCCPMPQAVCCQDNVHCCPNGYTCDLSAGKCEKSFITLPWLEKQPAAITAPLKEEVEAVQCDATHECPTGNTCCKTTSGQWGCCPMPQAVCCQDNVHCCPNGYTCDLSAGKCEKGFITLPWLEKQPATITAPLKEEVEAVQCDATHECPTGNTCCKTTSGQWGCCPMPQAVCCQDNVHCCPNGYTCDLSAGKCEKGFITLSWLEKQPATITAPLKEEVEAVQCDATHECPTGNTCCKTTSGQWGCCPMPQAVCCQDNVHCCPNGYTCDLSAGKCEKGFITLPWLEKQPATITAPLKEEVEAVQCDATHECPTGNTCCKTTSGQWGCCPMPQAVCCQDNVHCCPNGYTCDLSAGKCEKGFITLPWLEKQPATITVPLKEEVEAVQCDATHECPTGNTCCKTTSGQWGCCPMPQAVCCQDNVHCCPNGYTCDLSAGKCEKGFITLPWLEKQPATITAPLKEEVEAVQCDATHECPTGNTCCKTTSGQWGCCPMPQAVCCQDNVHCCPNGYTCDLSAGKCEKGFITLPWLEKQPATITAPLKEEVEAVQCDATHECPTGNTCCKTTSGQWGCCPMPQAVCCQDNVHCCPNGYTCDLSAGKCEKGFITLPWLEKQPATITAPLKEEVEAVQCDATHECPTGNTCCKTTSGQWGCCPMPQAVCCQDNVHCCPNGYTCDLSAGKCEKGFITLPWLEKQPATITAPLKEEVEAVQCDATHECPTGNTCCKTTSGQWGCCPMPQAVCCQDNVHCCPNGYTCDLSAGKCEKGFITLPWLEKQPATITAPLKEEVEAVQCDATHECPTGNTCCKTTSGQWGCCPMPQAVCCQDNVHCCPNGYTCDLSAGKCEKGFITLPWLEKQPATITAPLKEEVEAVQCDATHECPTGNTCCKTTSGQWGCCPMPQAVCCQDNVHCCPNGYTCDLSAGKCEKGFITLPWLEKQPATITAPLKEEVEAVQCDATHECPTGNTCCKTTSGQWGCCPMPQAVCCQDNVHCCPNGYTCDLSAGKCEKGFITLPWLEKQPATITAPLKEEVEAVQCDATHECPTGNTCCKTTSGQWGCCPMPQAVCCQDNVHFCPNGYTCDLSAGKCEKGFITLPWLEKQPATITAPLKEEVEAVQCDATHECPTGNTCCKTTSGQWGCCPMPQAVCCQDNVHCCPNGYTCDLSAGKCEKGFITLPWLEKQPATITAPLKEEVEAVQCDATHECPTGNTCCKTTSGQWGCCPMPQAVCCQDNVHCCPNGYTCDLSAGKCEKGFITLSWLEKQPATITAPLKEEVEAVQCDATHECPTGNTCCKTTSGQWGCCKMPQAVCCQDNVHCCPNGYTCDLSAGKCEKGFITLPWLQKQPATITAPLKEEVEAVQCDATHECPTGNTCCKTTSGQWGCCPMPQAVCCQDNVHCCPNGYTCDLSAGKCEKGFITLPWLEKQPATITAPLKEEVEAVQCDATHECPTGNTCCKTTSGQWGCCPMPQAVCCQDNVHCCPKGYTCDLSAGKCEKGFITLPWLEKQPATITAPLKEEVEAVQCDATHECPTGNTCCKTTSGQWGCCPMPQDNVHCCPNGYTCDLSAGKCEKGFITLSWLKKQPATITAPLKEEVEAVQCDATHECPTGNTCCKTTSGQWGCCPMPQAVCCQDNVHCCPNGYTCDLSAGKCEKGFITLPWLEKQPATITAPLKEEVEAVQCDATHECPTGNTCCKTTSGHWGCCPMPQAVCCQDNVHCCPNGYTCDLSAGKCEKGFITLPWLEKQPATITAPLKEEVEAVQCDATHECPTGNTCCKTTSGQWGCCPMPQAVCCQDNVHCCPNGYTCNLSAGKCEKGFITLPWLEKQPATITAPLKEEVEAVQCDATHECPTGNTCCKTTSGQWGCCPMPQAVCCQDNVHCCPNGYTCDLSAGKCEKGFITLPWLEKQPATITAPLKEEVEAVQCDATHECPTGNTCCKTTSGHWGCCPMPQAVCCQDNVHCCPNGYTCDLSAGKCEKGFITLPWLEKQPATITAPLKEEVEAVQCDATHECPTGNTCCKTTSGQWGCCPMPQAVCCQDNVHCCPNGYTCDLSAGKCEKGFITLPWLEKQPATITAPLKEEVEAVQCDATHECPTGNTCCKTTSGHWGCCPMPQAVCCQDNVHCCPNGYTCDLSAGKCEKGFITLPWLEKQPATITAPLKEEVEAVQCDATHECPTGNTCCKTTSGHWGCCPMPQAVCCQDNVHCCPNGYTCDLSAGKCEKGFITLPWLEKQSATITAPLKEEVEAVQCDATHECPTGNTCCKTTLGQWGCCPMPQAVCCQDNVHCCPNGYTCDLPAGKCEKGFITLPWLEKQPATITAPLKEEVEAVQCDATHECPTGNTCCKTTSGQWGCCPMPQAVCCQDNVHCCPNGYTCDLSAGKCEKGFITLPWLEKQPATITAPLKEEVEAVQCDATHECPTGNTCCKTTSGQWGCCPMPQAVCCQDNVHCCPNGYTCDLSAGKCEKGFITLPWLEKQPATITAPLKEEVEAVQCDATHECPTGNTCCKTTSGQWGCCPMPQAMCCQDHVHCCPNGYTCDLSAGKCEKGFITLPWLEKQPATITAPLKEEVEAVQCDATHECPTGNTCCKTASGQWGCCPMPQAVCCQDHVHCCPNGYTCDLSAGKCEKGFITLPWLEKQPATITAPLKEEGEAVKCDTTHECPSGNTCCKTASGQWGCCPLLQAVCCQDHLHCCPNGYKCQTSEGKCEKGFFAIPWLNKTPALFTP